MDDILETTCLAARARCGDRAALGRLLDQHQSILFAIAYRQLGNYADAQDSVAITTLQVCLHIEQLKEPQRVSAWMQAILRNEIRHCHTKAKRVAQLINEFSAKSGPDDVSHTIHRVDIEHALSMLSPNEAQAVRLFYLDGLPLSDIARRTGRSEATIKTWLQRGRQQIATKLKGYDTMTKPPVNTKLGAGAESSKRARAALLLPDTIDPVLVDLVTERVRREGYEPVRVSIVESLESYESVFRLRQLFQAFVFAEPLGDRSVLEYILLLNARSKPFPIVVVVTEPLHSLRVNMFHAAKAGNVVTWDDIQGDDEMTLLRLPERDFWLLFNPALSGIFVLARDEATLLKADAINTGHLLLALLQKVQSRSMVFHDPESLEHILPIFLPVAYDQIRQRIPASSAPIASETLRPATDLRDALEQVRSRVEQTGRPATPEDLLWIIFQDPESIGGQILRELDISPSEKAAPPRKL